MLARDETAIVASAFQEARHLAPHFADALLTRDLGDDGPDLDRTFEYAVTYRRDVVVRAAQALVSRVAPADSAVHALADAA